MTVWGPCQRDLFESRLTFVTIILQLEAGPSGSGHGCFSTAVDGVELRVSTLYDAPEDSVTGEIAGG